MKLRCLPIVRHVRYFYYAYSYSRFWENVGRHYWITPNERDYEFLNAIWKGEE